MTNGNIYNVTCRERDASGPDYQDGIYVNVTIFFLRNQTGESRRAITYSSALGSFQWLMES
jgi:hypothetical protein